MNNESLTEMPHLSPRETQVLILAGQGMTMEESAAKLGIGTRTVKAHSDSVRRKLAVPGGKPLRRWQLITLAQFYEWPK